LTLIVALTTVLRTNVLHCVISYINRHFTYLLLFLLIEQHSTEIRTNCTEIVRGSTILIYCNNVDLTVYLYNYCLSDNSIILLVYVSISSHVKHLF